MSADNIHRLDELAGMTAFEACVVHLSAMLERPVTRGALRALHPLRRDDGTPQGRAMAVRAAIDAARKSGLRAAFGRRTLDGMSAKLLPAILFPPRGDPVVLHGLDDERAIIHDPAFGAGLIEKSRDTFISWAGAGELYVLTFKPDVRNDPDTHPADAERHWFRSALQQNRWSYTQVALASAMVNVLTVTISLFAMVVYDRVLPSAATQSLYALAIGVGIALLFDLIVKSLRTGFIDHAGHRADLAMGQRLFDHMVDIQMSARRGSVGQVAASMREMESLRDFFTSATMAAIVDLPFVFLFLGLILLLSGPLVIVPVVAVALILIIGLAVQPALSRVTDRILSEGQTKQTVLIETLHGIETIKAVGAARHMRTRWKAALQRQSEYAVRSRVLTQGAINTTGFVQQGAQIAIIVFGALLVIGGSITSGVLIAAVILTGRALAPMALISQTLTRFHQARSAYRNLDGLMSEAAEHPAGKRWVSRPRLSGGLRFENVRFAYPGQQDLALDGVSFAIRPGERVAIVGSVGSGKSTIMRLALGLFQPDEGVVQADGIDIRQIDPADLRSNFGAVMQDDWLVSGTVLENIALGAYHPATEDVLRAGKLAGVEDFIARHPEGYHMQLTERGGGLSGGQRQMVVLARALLANPAILIMDEPTASLDTDSENALIERLKTVLPGRTLIVMTHRMSLLQLVDRVIVLENGRIKADGVRSAGRDPTSVPARVVS